MIGSGPMSGSTSIPTAGWRGCASMARCIATGQPGQAQAWSISAALDNGGRAIACSDQHYGSPQNLSAAGSRRQHGRWLGDAAGAASRAMTGPSLRSAIAAGSGASRSTPRISRATTPTAARSRRPMSTGGTDESLVTQSMFWRTLLPEQKLQMDRLARLRARDRRPRTRHPCPPQHHPRRRRQPPPAVGPCT